MLMATWFSLVSMGFIPHGHCYLWKPGLVWLHFAADALTALAYYSIPLTLIYFIRKRRDVPFGWMFHCFSAFIIACGTTHLISIWTIWHPVYWLSGMVKALTAGVSLYTAVMLVPLVPKALALPSAAELEAANHQLAKEVAERKKIEETLRQSEARYRAVVEDQTEFICRFLPDGTLTFLNGAYCRYFGQSQESLVGQPFTPAVLEADVKAQLETLEVENPVTTIENRIVHPNGEIRVHQWISRAIFDSDDRPIEFQAVGRDITALKQAEAALQESQRFVQKVADTAPVILYVYDLEKQRNVYINQEFTELLGYTDEEIRSMAQKVLPNLIHPEDFLGLQEFVQQWATAQDSDILRFEYRMRHRNGNWQYFQCRETVFARSSNGTPKQILGAAVDVSDHKLVQQLKVALKEKEVLIKEIHHRVKNNLQIVYSLLRLQQRKLADEQAKIVLLDSQNRIKTIALIHEKLYRSDDFSKVDLQHYICQITTGLFSAYRACSDRIALETKIEPIPLDIDTAVLCGLIINELVSNSLKYAFSEHQKGKIFIEINLEQGERVHLRVGDDGVGFPTDVSHAGANSLGLKLVSDLVAQLEGTLMISNPSASHQHISYQSNPYQSNPAISLSVSSNPAPKPIPTQSASRPGVEFQISFPWRKL
jgi:PAS domain S-box-containing protein